MSNNILDHLNSNIILVRTIRTIIRKLKRLIRLFAWLVQRVADISSSDGKQRLLIIYDLSCQPFSVGDVLVAQEAAHVLQELYKVQFVDFAFICDAAEISKKPAWSTVTNENIFYSLPPILSAAQVNEHLGSIYLFNSHSQAYRFIADNSEQYHIWPSGQQIGGRDYVYYSVFNELLYSYFEEKKTIPKLSSRQFILDWAANFVIEKIYPDIPITIHIRNNKHVGTHRNSVIESWLSFFKYCEGRFSAKFIIICSVNEIDDRLRQFSNVIIAKDFHTNTEQELALIEIAEIHMGASSGMGAMALFNKKPFLIVNTDVVCDLYRGLIKDGNFVSFFFSTPLQRFSIGKETPELLIEEFSKMWVTINIDTWREAIIKATRSENKTYFWLR